MTAEGDTDLGSATHSEESDFVDFRRGDRGWQCGDGGDVRSSAKGRRATKLWSGSGVGEGGGAVEWASWVGSDRIWYWLAEAVGVFWGCRRCP